MDAFMHLCNRSRSLVFWITLWAVSNFDDCKVCACTLNFSGTCVFVSLNQELYIVVVFSLVFFLS